MILMMSLCYLSVRGKEFKYHVKVVPQETPKPTICNSMSSAVFWKAPRTSWEAHRAPGVVSYHMEGDKPKSASENNYPSSMDSLIKWFRNTIVGEKGMGIRRLDDITNIMSSVSTKKVKDTKETQVVCEIAVTKKNEETETISVIISYDNVWKHKP